MTELSISRAQFRESCQQSSPVVVKLTATLDVDVDPTTAYAAVSGRTTDRSSEYAFLLESAEKTPSSDPAGAFRPSREATDRHARYSFVGYDPAAVITIGSDEPTAEIVGPDRYADLVEIDGGDTVDQLRSALPSATPVEFNGKDRQRLDGGLVGFLAYDAIYDLHLSELDYDRPKSTTPDAQYVLATKVITFDELTDTTELVFTPVVRPEDDPDAIYDRLLDEAERIEQTLLDCSPPQPGGFQKSDEQAGSREAYEQAVKQAKEHVLNGDIYQGVISRTRELYGSVDPLGLYVALRDINPSPYMYLLNFGPRQIVGASPETLVSVRDREVMVNPIAGTCPRGSSPVEDRRLAGEMLADDKERAEHTMLVDLARNDVRRVSESGSVRVDEFMSVLKYSHVQHIESTVTGRLRNSCDAFDAMRATFPAGTLTGAPKIRAMEIIDDLEEQPRGVYGGGVGYFTWTGDADSAIVIRTATIDTVDNQQRISVRAGAGLVADSDPTAEYEETEAKMDGVLAAIDRIERAPQEVSR